MKLIKDRVFIEYCILAIIGGLNAILSYIINIVAANGLGPEAYGRYAYAFVIGAIFTQFIMFGTDEVAIRLRGTHGHKAMNWILSIKLLNFFIVLAGAIIALTITHNILILVAVILTTSALNYASHYESKNQNTRFAIIHIIERLCATISVLTIIFFVGENHLWWIFALFFIVASFSILFQLQENTEFRPTFNVKPILYMYRTGFFIVIFSFSKYAFGGLPRLLIFERLGETQMGIFATAWLFIPLSTIYFSQIIKVWRRRITESLDTKNYSELKGHIIFLVLACFVPALFAFGMISSFSQEITALLFSDAYTKTAELLPYIGIYYIAIGADTIVVLLAIAISRIQTLAVIYLIVATLTALVCYSLPTDAKLVTYIIVTIIGHILASAALAVVVVGQMRKTLHDHQKPSIETAP